MKFITVRDMRTSPARIWSQLSEEQEMVITNNGKPIALLTPLSDETLEGTLSAVRQARAIEAVRKMQQISRERGVSTIGEGEIDDEIHRARGDRTR